MKAMQPRDHGTALPPGLVAKRSVAARGVETTPEESPPVASSRWQPGGGLAPAASDAQSGHLGTSASRPAAARRGHHISTLPLRSPRPGETQPELAPAPAAGDRRAPVPSTQPAATAPIQRLIDHSRLDESEGLGELADNLRGGIRKFNRLEELGNEKGGQEALHAQFAALHAVETQANAHLRVSKKNVAPRDREALFHLLGQVDQHRNRLTAQTVESGADLWLPDEVQGQDRDHAQSLWSSIAGGKGNIQIESSREGFRHETLAGVGKLLQGAHGRGLLDELNSPQKDDDPLRRVVISDDFSQRFEKLPKADLKPGSWAQPMSVAHGQGKLHEKVGTGTGSYVQIAAEEPLANLGEHLLGTQEEPIFGPDFITLGHELGHARHQLRGTSKNPVTDREATLEDQLWTEPEEKENITQEENPLRAEHGLAERKYHVSGTAASAHRVRFPLNQRLTGITNTVPEDLRGEFSEDLDAGTLSTQIDQFDATDEEEARSLHGRLDDLESRVPSWLEKQPPFDERERRREDAERRLKERRRQQALAQQAQKQQGRPQQPGARPQPGWFGSGVRFARDNWRPLAVAGLATAVGTAGYLLSDYLKQQNEGQ